jgi:hypothetical protein
MRKQADTLKVCPIPDACLLVMAQRPSRLLGLAETRSLSFLIKNSPDQAEGYLDYLQPALFNPMSSSERNLHRSMKGKEALCCEKCIGGRNVEMSFSRMNVVVRDV